LICEKRLDNNLEAIEYYLQPYQDVFSGIESDLVFCSAFDIHSTNNAPAIIDEADRILLQKPFIT
jgi:hypothetical protein